MHYASKSGILVNLHLLFIMKGLPLGQGRVKCGTIGHLIIKSSNKYSNNFVKPDMLLLGVTFSASLTHHGTHPTCKFGYIYIMVKYIFRYILCKY